MRCLPEIYKEKVSVWASYRSDEKYDKESGKTNNKWPQVWKVACDKLLMQTLIELYSEGKLNNI